jgi:hypothetical protein
MYRTPTTLGTFSESVSNALAPVYSSLSRVALTEAESKYGPFVVGFTIGLFAFVLYLGRVVHHRAPA